MRGSRLVGRSLLALSIGLACVRTVAAQCAADWAAGFEGTSVSNQVHASAVFDDGRGPALYVGGLFDSAGEVLAKNIARWDGTHFEALGTGTDSYVRALVMHDDGSGAALYAGGWFTTAGGVPAAGVARWNGTSWSAVGGSFAGTVERLRVLDLGAGPELFACGGFASAGGTPAVGLARWNGTSWSSFGTSGAFFVSDMAVFDDGSGDALFVGGSFLSTGTTPANSLARWNGSAWSAVGTGANGPVHALQVATLGGPEALFVAGQFTIAGGVPANRIARYDGASWSPLGAGLTATFGPAVRELAVHDDGAGLALYAGGVFDHAGAVEANDLARWNGASWSSVGGSALDPGNGVETLCTYDVGSGARLFAGGLFFGMGGAVARGAASWDGGEWSSLGEGNGVGGAIDAFVVHDDGPGPALYAAGPFTSAGPVRAFGLARWSGSAWSDVGGMSGTTYALASFDDGLGSGPALYAAGDFGSAGSVPAVRIARWNGTSWSSLASGLPGTCRALCVYDDGAGAALWAAGEVAGLGAYLQRWNGATWSVVSPAPNAAVLTLAVHDDGTGSALYTGGHLMSIGTLTTSRVARWNGSSWSAVGTGAPTDFRVSALTTWDDGTGPALYAGGRFSVIDGVPASRVARWNGTSWSAVGGGVDAGVAALLAHDDGTGSALYATGAFTTAGGQPAARIARWNGSAWSALGAGLTDDGVALAVFDDGHPNAPALFVGGEFATAGGRGARGLAKWSSCGAPGAVFCTGDGLDALVTTPCPCANTGGPGRGCANSVEPLGARLRATGSANPDTVTLLGDGMPGTVTAIYLKGSTSAAHGVVFGDGVRCVDGALIRLSTVHNTAGASQYPLGTQPRLSVRGQTPPGSGLVGRYQVYYRNAAAGFCPPETFNVSNGYRIAW
ncbi:MAG: hypothetical protein IPJ77_23715 [Planctomycetes bacterium]|nr:hypothetical protein [Planctomycetota bacterium]